MMARVYRVRGAIGYWIAVTVIAVGLAWVVLLVISLRHQADQASDESAINQEAVEVLAEDVRTLREQVEAAGEEPAAPDPEERVDDLPAVDEPVVIQGQDGEDGRDAPPPTAAQIRTAVGAVLRRDPDLPESQVAAATVDYLQENPPPPGDDGDDGEDGRPPTEGEIEVAVATFCADGACRGADGEDGAGPTDEQIAAAVARYCDDRGECRGPAGSDGQDGEPGEAGQPGPTCPDGTDPIVWNVDTQSAIVGLDEGTYLICRAEDPEEETS